MAEIEAIAFDQHADGSVTVAHWPEHVAFSEVLLERPSRFLWTDGSTVTVKTANAVAVYRLTGPRGGRDPLELRPIGAELVEVVTVDD